MGDKMRSMNTHLFFTPDQLVAVHDNSEDGNCTGCVFDDDGCRRAYHQDSTFPCAQHVRPDGQNVIWVLKSLGESLAATKHTPIYTKTFQFPNNFTTTDQKMADFVSKNYDLIDTIFQSWTRSYDDLVEALYMLKPA